MPEKSTEPQQNGHETARNRPPVSRATERQRSEAVGMRLQSVLEVATNPTYIVSHIVGSRS